MTRTLADEAQPEDSDVKETDATAENEVDVEEGKWVLNRFRIFLRVIMLQ